MGWPNWFELLPPLAHCVNHVPQWLHACMLIQSWNDAQYVQCTSCPHLHAMPHSQGMGCCRRLQSSTVQTCILHIELLNMWSTSGPLLCVVNDGIHSVVPSCSNLRWSEAKWFAPAIWGWNETNHIFTFSCEVVIASFTGLYSWLLSSKLEVLTATLSVVVTAPPPPRWAECYSMIKISQTSPHKLYIYMQYCYTGSRVH